MAVHAVLVIVKLKALKASYALALLASWTHTEKRYVPGGTNVDQLNAVLAEYDWTSVQDPPGASIQNSKRGFGQPVLVAVNCSGWPRCTDGQPGDPVTLIPVHPVTVST